MSSGSARQRAKQILAQLRARRRRERELASVAQRERRARPPLDSRRASIVAKRHANRTFARRRTAHHDDERVVLDDDAAAAPRSVRPMRVALT